jgi:Rieske Fe-S protein
MKGLEEGLHRRQVIEAGVAGAALLVLPEACSSSPSPSPPGKDGGGGHDATVEDGPPPDTSPVDTGPPCNPTSEVDAGTACAQNAQTAAINISKAGIGMPGTSYEFSDCRYSDPQCMQAQIILIHPVTKTGYVALSGSCPHDCCANTMGTGGPTYIPSCTLSVDEGIIGGFACNAADAGTPDGGSDAGGDAAPDAAADATTDAGGGLVAGQTYQDVLYCTCHGSMFSALDGSLLNGPASVGLAQLTTCEADGFVFVTIPES